MVMLVNPHWLRPAGRQALTAAAPYIAWAAGAAAPARTLDLTAMGLQENDVVIVAICQDAYGYSDPAFVSSGWTEYADQGWGAGTSDNQLVLGWKRMGSSPDTSVTMTTNSARPAAGMAYAIRGLPTSGSPIASSSGAGANTGTAIDPNAVNTTFAGQLVVVVASAVRPTVGITQPSNELIDFFAARGGAIDQPAIAFGSYLKATAGSFNPVALAGGTSGGAFCHVTTALT